MKNNSLEEIFSKYQITNTRGMMIPLLDTEIGKDLLEEIKASFQPKIDDGYNDLNRPLDNKHEIDLSWLSQLKNDAEHNANRALEIAKERDEFEAKYKGLDIKIEELSTLTSNFPFIEFYPHTHCDMYKILNEYTKYREDKWVLTPVSEGFEKALDTAIKQFTDQKNAHDTTRTS